MRLIHTVPGVSEESSGPSYSVVRLCESLIEEGQDLALAALEWPTNGVRLPFLKTFPLGLGPTRLGRSPMMKRWLDEQALSETIDIIHNHGMWQMNAVYPSWVARKSKIPLVVSPRGTFSEQAMQNGSPIKRVFWPLIQRPALAPTSCFHATAESEYKDIRRMGFCQPVAVIPNGIDIPEFSSKTMGTPRTLLFLGRVHPIKGLDILLSAWRAVQDRFPEWQLLVAGSDDGYHGPSGYLNELRKLAHDLRVHRLTFVGQVSGDNKWQSYRDADLFVLPSYSENFAMTIAEALATGTPAITTHGTPWEGLTQHRAGWWIEAKKDSLVACLENALNHSSQALSEMGLRGRSWMQEDFSWRNIAHRMAETYKWLEGSRTTVPLWVHVD